MKNLTLAFLLLLAATSVYASEWDDKSVAIVIEQIKSGKDFTESGVYPHHQIVNFTFGGFTYVIDVKAKLCFFNYGNLTSVPCKSLKEGYPTMAPIITWEK
jgi:hypothetical protein